MPDTTPSDWIEFNVENAQYVEGLVKEFLRDKRIIPQEWRNYIAGSHVVEGLESINGETAPSFLPASIFNPPLNGTESRQRQEAHSLQERADQLVHAYRSLGHRAANLDPLALAPRDSEPLDPAVYNLTNEDDRREIIYRSTFSGEQEWTTLGNLRQRLAQIYCGSIGFEYTHINNRKMRDWLQRRIEQTNQWDSPPKDTQLRILTRLTDAVIFEQFVRKKYVGAKTFSLEGAETLIPLLDLGLDKAAKQDTAEAVIGMAHRGRLNVLANIVGKRPLEIFREFEDQHPDWWRGKGDVKYHLGASGEWEAAGGSQLHVSLCFNPSHLEFVNPVALGRVRAKQNRDGDCPRRRALAILIHGDAGFAGEGIVQESLNMSGLKDYHTGGALHVIVNNQLGFTTPPEEGRSSEYASDVAKLLQIPVFHVNGEFPQAVARVVDLAMDFRMTFGRDVVIDMFCFRRWGHNEADEPAFTQPLMYQAIEHRSSIRDSYLEHLLELGKVTRDEADEIANHQRKRLQGQFQEAQESSSQPNERSQAGVWEPYSGGDEPKDDHDTAVEPGRLKSLLQKLTQLPENFHLHKKLSRSVERRQRMAEEEEPVDWATAEALAFATLAVEGHPVRLAGQDSVRGTFSQRHATLHDIVDSHAISPFEGLTEDQAPIEVVNSPLSEAGALAFEYGYSLDYPEALTLWEAQYGDFVNAAQVVIDQFVASAEDKWRRLSGLVLLLPHGFEGKGPEHSSARLERFLNLAVEENVQVVCPSTPAQYFHVLRRQVKRKWRKPLIVLTPKSLLRHPDMASNLEDLTSGGFQRILGDTRTEPRETTCILLSSGKMYYDLVAAREKLQDSDVAILRIEQFYPLSDDTIAEAMKPYTEETPVRWVQEEPENMGAWPYWKYRYCSRLLNRFPLSVVARPPSASPATGSSAAHRAEQNDLIKCAFQSVGK